MILNQTRRPPHPPPNVKKAPEKRNHLHPRVTTYNLLHSLMLSLDLESDTPKGKKTRGVNHKWDWQETKLLIDLHVQHGPNWGKIIQEAHKKHVMTDITDDDSGHTKIRNAWGNLKTPGSFLNNESKELEKFSPEENWTEQELAQKQLLHSQQMVELRKEYKAKYEKEVDKQIIMKTNAASNQETQLKKMEETAEERKKIKEERINVIKENAVKDAKRADTEIEFLSSTTSAMNQIARAAEDQKALVQAQQQAFADISKFYQMKQRVLAFTHPDAFRNSPNHSSDSSQTS